MREFQILRNYWTKIRKERLWRRSASSIAYERARLRTWRRYEKCTTLYWKSKIWWRTQRAIKRQMQFMLCAKWVILVEIWVCKSNFIEIITKLHIQTLGAVNVQFCYLESFNMNHCPHCPLIFYPRYLCYIIGNLTILVSSFTLSERARSLKN